MRTANPFYAARIARRRNVYNVLDLFSGIGGFSLGLEKAGVRTAVFCEIDPFCQSILKKHWPSTPIYNDIKQLTAKSLHNDNINTIDIICGDYPCQPFSVAGPRRGEDDPRHLWPEMHRLIRELRPRWVICENVAGHVQLDLDAVLADLDAAGYSATPFIIPACAVGAAHRRDRVWIVANTAGVRLPRAVGSQERYASSSLSASQVRWDLPAPFTIGSDDGFPPGWTEPTR